MDQPIQPVKLNDFTLDDKVKNSIRGAANAGGVAAMLILISALIGIVSFVISLANPPEPDSILEGFDRQPGFEGSAVTDGIGLIISLAISALMFYFLNRFATYTKSALNNNNQNQLVDGLEKLASYFKTLGIIFIIVCCVSVLAFFAILAGTGTA
jgi:hypothetical protein